MQNADADSYYDPDENNNEGQQLEDKESEDSYQQPQIVRKKK